MSRRLAECHRKPLEIKKCQLQQMRNME